MRELQVSEYEFVFGGADMSPGDLMGWASGIGGGIGLSRGATLGLGALEAVGLAGVGAATAGGLMAAGIGGWKLGQALNDHTPVQRWIAQGLEWLDKTVDGDE
ncbi:hypothetical protein [Mitsuaria sp. GD03876]|uniref:hypothetical protein n=1 Tax=Mitsuaria sp. GD03876 TaxID=2975399 RepID=UPI00244C8B17|nr:hypothetical protein [Mitsuaria sp. GD03876]MDH0864535.1 hypothetical protein [Mitsuaria sp. GD03876]